MLTLAEPDTELWERFRTGSLGDAEQAAHPVFSRWGRALRARKAAGPHASFVDAKELQARRARAAGVLVRSNLLEEAASELQRRGFALLLADGDGVIIASHGRACLSDPAVQAGVSAGARWSEADRGTNAIGVALIEKVPVTVIGRAHVDASGHSLVCYAAPICDCEGRLVGVLDLTGPVDRADALLGITVQALAGLLETEYRASAGTEKRPSSIRSARPAARKASSQDGLPQRNCFEHILGDDPVLTDACKRASQFARSSLPVLLLAETGTGKELIARAIHDASDRDEGPFVVVNCGAMPESLLLSELFGYAPGAFTGARTQGAEGRIGAAEGGTLFLDEVAEMSPTLQAMLLRVLEDGSYSRVGEPKERHSSFRLVSATCQDLTVLVREGTFRRDLYFRIQGLTLKLPALRERRDLSLLARGLLDELAQDMGLSGPRTLSPAALESIARRPWPGNVRQLKMALHYALIASQGSALIEPLHLPPEAPEVDRDLQIRDSALRSAEAEALRQVLARSGGNTTLAARELGVARSTLYRMMERHGLRSPAAQR